MTPPSNAGGEGREVLAPCPFCGGEATVRTYQTESLWSHNVVTYTQVGCEECDYQRATEPGYDPEALVWWNTRPARENADDRAPALLEAAVAEMRERAAKVVDHYHDQIAEVLGQKDLSAKVLGQIFPMIQLADAMRAAIRALPTPSQEASNVG